MDQSRRHHRRVGRGIFAVEREQALRMLERAPRLQLATTADDGSPVGGGVGFVLRDGAVHIHEPGLDHVGRPAVLTAEHIVARLPDGAGIWLERVRLSGVLEPDGSRTAMSLASLEGESRLGQELAPEARRAMLERLWTRGLPGDAAAIEAALQASPGTPTPGFLDAPAGATLSCALGEYDLEEAVDLLECEYWNRDLPRSEIAAAQLGSDAWVGARDEAGRLVANARAISDGPKYAWIYDVVVRDDWRSRGLGRALMRMLLDHPAVRGARTTLLDTRDAQRLYQRFGFVDRAAVTRPYPTTQMVRRRF